MNNSLAKQFSKFLSDRDFYAANEIIKKARALDYPYGLINSWETSLANLEPGIRHPLDSVQEPDQGDQNLCLQLDQNLKETFQANLTEYCVENDISVDLAVKIAGQTFDNFDQNSGEMLVPDLTATDPSITLLHYSISQYVIDNPDISDALKRGLIPSEIDHFLRFGYFEILKGRRYSSLCLSHERKKYNGKLLYIVDDFSQLTDEEIVNFKSPQLGIFSADIFSVKHNSVFTSAGLCLDIEKYLFQNISEYHNLCILLPNKSLSIAAKKWIIDIKLNDQAAIFGYSKSNGRFCAVTEYSHANMLISDVTNGLAIVNAIEALSVVGNIRGYESAYGFYHALILQMHEIGVDFCLKKEILSQGENDESINISPINNACWSPFFWATSESSSNKSLLSSIRSDLIRTWSNLLSLGDLDKNVINSDKDLAVDLQKLVVHLKPSSNYTVGVVIPFRDQIHLLANCVDSLMHKKEAIGFKIYAINNDSSEPETFEVLDQLIGKYPDHFICINSPGEFNYAKINNEAVAKVEEDYVLLLNNDILIDSNFAITTLLKTHLFYNAVITGSKLLYPSGKIQHNGLACTQEKHIAVNSPFRGQQTKLHHEFLSDRDIHPWDRTHECSAVTAACLLIKKQDFLDIGGFDEDFKVAYNDVDLCFRAKEKFISKPIVCSTDLKIFHLESESRGSDADIDKQARLYHERIKLVNRHEHLFAHTDKFTGVDYSSDDLNKFIKTNFDLKFIDLSSAPKSDIDLEELYFYQSEDSENKKYACVFVHYDKDSLIAEDCIHHVEKLSEYCDVYFVSSSEPLAKLPELTDKIKPFCKQILIRRNSGYDFGCWSHVIRKNYNLLADYDGVLLANDSNWGPLHDFSDTFIKVNRMLAEVDFVGLTSSTTPSWHLQSFFIMYSKKVFNSSYFKQHWFNIGIHDSKFDIIMNYEVSWSNRLRRLGFDGSSLYGAPSANNPTHVDWEILINDNYPYLKKELIRDNPLQIDLANLPKILSTYEKNWTSWLLNYLQSYGKENSYIAQSLRF